MIEHLADHWMTYYFLFFTGFFYWMIKQEEKITREWQGISKEWEQAYLIEVYKTKKLMEYIENNAVDQRLGKLLSDSVIQCGEENKRLHLTFNSNLRPMFPNVTLVLEPNDDTNVTVN